MIFKDYLSM